MLRYLCFAFALCMTTPGMAAESSAQATPNLPEPLPYNATMILDYNGEISGMLNHLSRESWNDKAVRSFFSPAAQAKLKPGQYAHLHTELGRFMGYGGITQIEGDESKAVLQAIAEFEHKKVKVEVELERFQVPTNHTLYYRANRLTITPLAAASHSLDGEFC